MSLISSARRASRPSTRRWPCDDPINNNAGNNDEIFSFHPGGANVLFGDGSVKFMKETTAILIIRSLVTPNGGEVISADQF